MLATRPNRMHSEISNTIFAYALTSHMYSYSANDFSYKLLARYALNNGHALIKQYALNNQILWF